MRPKHQLGDLQLAIMRVLWDRGEASAAEVHDALEAERGLALTTIKTMLRKMDEKGLVTHRVNGRSFDYTASISEKDVRTGMVGDIVDRVFRGDGVALVNHLIEAGEIDAAELDELRARLAARRGRA